MRRMLMMSIAIAAIGVAPVATAKDYAVGPITIEQPWARASAGAAANGAAYMTISTGSSAPDQLIAAASPVAATVELHTHVMDGEVMRMRPVKLIDVNVGEPAVLRPGGLHIMLIGLTAPLKEGETFPLTLTFAKAGAVTVDVAVQGAGAGAAGMGQHRH